MRPGAEHAKRAGERLRSPALSYAGFACPVPQSGPPIEMLCGAGQGKALLRKALHAHGRRRAASPSAIHLQMFRLQE